MQDVSAHDLLQYLLKSLLPLPYEKYNLLQHLALKKHSIDYALIHPKFFEKRKFEKHRGLKLNGVKVRYVGWLNARLLILKDLYKLVLIYFGPDVKNHVCLMQQSAKPVNHSHAE